MEGDKNKTLPGQLKALVKANEDLPLKLKQHLVPERSKLENPSKFIAELLNEGMQRDGSADLDAHFVFKGMLVQLAVTIDCSKSPDGLDGLVKALESSGNLRLISALQTWAEEDYQGETDDDDVGPNKPEACTSAHQSQPTKELRRNVKTSTETSLANSTVDKNLEGLKDADNQETAETSQKVKKKKLKKETLKCRFCPRTLRSPSSRCQHEHLHREPSKCTYEACWNHPKTFAQPSSFYKHLRDFHAQIWEVEFCELAQLGEKIPKRRPASKKIVRPKYNLRHR